MSFSCDPASECSHVSACFIGLGSEELPVVVVGSCRDELAVAAAVADAGDGGLWKQLYLKPPLAAAHRHRCRLRLLFFRRRFGSLGFCDAVASLLRLLLLLTAQCKPVGQWFRVEAADCAAQLLPQPPSRDCIALHKHTA